MKYLNKTDIISSIVKKTGITKKDSAAVLNTLISVITDALAKKQGIRLVGFGSFKVSYRKARKGRNPQTGKSLTIPSRDVPVFKAGRDLKRVVNK